MGVKRKVIAPDYADLLLDLPNNGLLEEEEADKGHGDSRKLSSMVMTYWLSLQASPFIIVLIILCLFMAAFMATHTNLISPDFHIMSDSILDSQRPLQEIFRLRRSVAAPSSQEATAAQLVAPQRPAAVSLPVGWEGCLTEIPPDPERRHIVPPPAGNVTLVCCNTTQGLLDIEVHPTWAPLGAERFLYMVRDRFFETEVPLFRALKGFLVQFGLAGDPEVQRRYHKMGNLVDDPPWLPLGPPGRQINGIKRYRKGYLGYAGAGKDSRGTQLILAFEDSAYLGGGSPWEVPFGQLIGERSFNTMKHFYTGEQILHTKNLSNKIIMFLQQAMERSHPKARS